VVSATSGGGSEVASVTIGGVSATLVIETTGGIAQDFQCLYQADVPTGTTGDIVVVFDGGVGQCGIGVWRVTGAGTGPSAANDTDMDVTASGAMPLAVSCPANGVIIVAAKNVNSATHTTVGVTEDFDGTVESVLTHTGASDEFATTQTNLDVTVTPSASNNEQGAVCASWGPG
jgi:hypothetical protein